MSTAVQTTHAERLANARRVVVDGRVALPEGNANDHATSGVLDIWRLR